MSGHDRTIVAGTTVARDGFAALIRGPSGAGKSDLALRCIMSGFEPRFDLVSDDQTTVHLQDGNLLAAAPKAITGKLEVRGVGIVTLVPVVGAQVVLLVDLTDGPVERLPAYPGPRESILGQALDRLVLRPFEASAPYKLAIALERAAAARRN